MTSITKIYNFTSGIYFDSTDEMFTQKLLKMRTTDFILLVDQNGWEMPRAYEQLSHGIVIINKAFAHNDDVEDAFIKLKRVEKSGVCQGRLTMINDVCFVNQHHFVSSSDKLSSRVYKFAAMLSNLPSMKSPTFEPFKVVTQINHISVGYYIIDEPHFSHDNVKSIN